MKRLFLVLGAALVALPLGAQTATPTRTPTITPTPVQGATISYIWDAFANVTAGATSAGARVYWERAGTQAGTNAPQNPAARYEVKIPATGNGCYQLLRSSGAADTDLENITPGGGCLTAGASVSLPVCGPCRLYLRVATTPTPNTTPLHAYVSVSGDQLIRVWPATPTPTPTP